MFPRLRTLVLKPPTICKTVSVVAIQCPHLQLSDERSGLWQLSNCGCISIIHSSTIDKLSSGLPLCSAYETVASPVLCAAGHYCGVPGVTNVGFLTVPPVQFACTYFGGDFES